MNFFEQQDASRRRTRRLLVAFTLAVLAVVTAVTWVLVSTAAFMRGEDIVAGSAWIWAHPGVTLITALCVFGVI
ncbi:MAG: peptidase M48, partial [Gammaproteobacteria bacterium]|nr:peptidase M48 [Gammaproteobacteria bacterium]